MKLIALIMLFLVAQEAHASEKQFMSRHYYGAKLEPVAHVLHGAGQCRWDNGTVEYRQALNGQYAPAVIMDYVSPQWGASVVDNFITTEANWLSNFPKYTVLQLGLEMKGRELNVANGVYDSNLNYLFTALKRLNLPIYMRIGFECNGSWNSYRPASYKAAFIHVVNMIRRSGLEVAIVWCISADGNPNYMRWYPGDKYVDWWAIDLFSASHFKDPITRNFLKDADSHRKPVMIGESTPRYVGVLDGEKSWDKWFAPYFELIHTSPGIKAFCYINWNWAKYPRWKNWGDARLGQNKEVADLYRKEMSLPLYQHSSTKKAFRKSLAATGKAKAPNK